MDSETHLLNLLRRLQYRLDRLPPQQTKHWQDRYAELRATHKVRAALNQINLELKEDTP